MSNPISPGLDPASYLALSANLASGVGDPVTLKTQSDELLAACQGGDYTVMIRHHNAIVLSSQLAAHNALQRSMQCDSPQEQQQWLLSARQAQAMADQATQQVVSLTNTAEKLKPYYRALMQQASAAATLQLQFEKGGLAGKLRDSERLRLEAEQKIVELEKQLASVLVIEHKPDPVPW